MAKLRKSTQRENGAQAPRGPPETSPSCRSTPASPAREPFSRAGRSTGRRVRKLSGCARRDHRHGRSAN